MMDKEQKAEAKPAPQIILTQPRSQAEIAAFQQRCDQQARDPNSDIPR